MSWPIPNICSKIVKSKKIVIVSEMDVSLLNHESCHDWLSHSTSHWLLHSQMSAVGARPVLHKGSAECESEASRSGKIGSGVMIGFTK
jgi:serine acetyltransferase